MGIFNPYGQAGSFDCYSRQAMQQYQILQQQPILNSGALAGYMRLLAEEKGKSQPIDRPEPDEFVWLRNRVNEILWR